MNKVMNPALVKLAVVAMYIDRGPMQKTAEQRFLYRMSADAIDSEVLGDHFCKLARATGYNPWGAAYKVACDLTKIAKQVESPDTNIRKVAQFYMDWASGLEKAALVKQIGGAVKRLVGMGEHAAPAAAKAEGQLAHMAQTPAAQQAGAALTAGDVARIQGQAGAQEAKALQAAKVPAKGAPVAKNPVGEETRNARVPKPDKTGIHENTLAREDRGAANLGRAVEKEQAALKLPAQTPAAPVAAPAVPPSTVPIAGPAAVPGAAPVVTPPVQAPLTLGGVAQQALPLGLAGIGAGGAMGAANAMLAPAPPAYPPPMYPQM